MKRCLHCDKILKQKEKETNWDWNKRKYCNRYCVLHSEIMINHLRQITKLSIPITRLRNLTDNPAWRPEVKEKISKSRFKTGIKIYRKLIWEIEKRLKICEICQIKRKVVIHHKDFNRYNNNINNLMVVCYKCHTKIHRNLKSNQKTISQTHYTNKYTSDENKQY